MNPRPNPAKGIAIAYLIIAALVLIPSFLNCRQVLNADASWHDGYYALAKKARDNWNAQYPNGYHETTSSSAPYQSGGGGIDLAPGPTYDPFLMDNPDLGDSDHDPRFFDSPWRQSWPYYWIEAASALWLVSALYLIAPRPTALVIMSPITTIRFLYTRAGNIKKDDWFKIALVLSILLAATIIAVSLHWKSPQ